MTRPLSVFLLSHSWDKCVSAELSSETEKKTMWLTYSIAFNRFIQTVSPRYRETDRDCAVVISLFNFCVKFFFPVNSQLGVLKSIPLKLFTCQVAAKRLLCVSALSFARSISGTVIPIAAPHGWPRVCLDHTQHILFLFTLSRFLFALRCARWWLYFQAEFFRHVHTSCICVFNFIIASCCLCRFVYQMLNAMRNFHINEQ